jgi:hypothetical protein
VPVTPLVGAGLTPSDMSSVASNGTPVGPTDPPELIPSGVVTPSGGVAVSGSSTCANAGLAHNNNEAVAATNDGLMGCRHESGRTAAINKSFIGIPLLKSASPQRKPLDDRRKRLRSISRLDSGWALAPAQLNTSLFLLRPSVPGRRAYESTRIRFTFRANTKT